MTYTLSQITAAAEVLWPRSGAEEWDAPGLVVGNPAQSVSRVLLSVDVTAQVVRRVALAGVLIAALLPYLCIQIARFSGPKRETK